MKNKFQHKLYNYKAPPPERVWEKIAASLDESHLSDNFPLKLYNFQNNPPAGTWEKIKIGLAEEKVTSISQKRKFLPLLRYAAAAIIIGLISLTVLWIINNRENHTLIANKADSNLKKEITIDKTSDKTTPELILDNAQQSQDDAALEASKHTYAKLDITPQKRMMTLNPEYLTSCVEISRNINRLNPEEMYRDIYYSCIHSTVHIEADKYNTTDRYVMLMTPEGNIIRMAKKWSDLLCCVSGEEQDENCKDQLNKWRIKLASAPVAPSPGNFLDILKLVNSLNLP